jgi:hypothetical protein
VRTAVVFLALASAAMLQAAETVRLPATKDNSIVLVDKEWRDNAGGQPRIRIKGNQHIVAMMFDMAAMRGKLIKSAVLVCQKGDASIDGLTISTIQCDWDEMKSNALTSGMQAEEMWGYPGARFPALTGGNAFSLVCQARSEVKDGAYRWPVDPDLVHALATGTAYGLALHEWSADYSRNPTIYSREQSGKQPYLEVTLSDAAEPDPEPPTDLVAAYLDKHDPASLRLTLRAPKNGFAYEVKAGDKTLPRWTTLFVRPGEVQVIPICDVPQGVSKPAALAIATINRLGKRSAAAAVRLPLWGLGGYDFPVITYLSGPGRPPQGLAVIPLEDKYDAAGKPVGDLPSDYQLCNEVFDSQTIRLAAARGEVVGFQALIKRGSEPAAGAAGYKVRVACDLPGVRVEAYRAVYVACEGGRRIPDPLVPLAPAEEITLSAEEATPVCVDVYVPFDFKPPEVKGSLKLSDGRTLPILLAVRNFALPREASFACEMNAYGLPDKTSEFYRLQQIAYDHRVHANILAYGHNSTAPKARKSNIDMVLDTTAGIGIRESGFGVGKSESGGAKPSSPNSESRIPNPAIALRRMDEKRYNAIAPGAKHGFWGDFALAFGPYLSGEYFKDAWRGPVAPPGFYLTFHESWPLKVREFTSGDPDAYEAFKAKPIYAETFVNVLRDFIDRAAREGWGRAGFQVYLNNKGSLADPNKAPWILDEPAGYWDYRALAYYADLVRQAKGEKCPVNVQFRIDISRPEFDRGQLAGKADLWVVSSSAFHEYHRLVADRMEREGLRVWVYGSTNKVEESNRTVQAWVLDAYRGGARGIVPWQTINKDGSAMTKADQLGLFIFTKAADGKPVIRHSMRLAAYRRAEQDIEYLELLRRRPGETDHSINLLISHYVNLDGAVRTAYAEDAGTPEYSNVTPEGLRRLREYAAIVLARPE